MIQIRSNLLVESIIMIDEKIKHGNNVDSTNVVKKIWTNLGRRNNVGRAPQGQGLMGRDLMGWGWIGLALVCTTSDDREPVVPIADPVGPAYFSPPY